ncbi:phosphate ABC transporter permease subunit PstC [Halochromatium glycolicum]|uniref:Phosphate transport system permease protein n=1 Tax=Halochromatium glycolicum TaxID=85075 RepID=A0AAJ0U4L4_9GAMM|nr:phosphate ABC transporter permease subunit PstC [Halochromatium glycolicum]MBK1705188.1 phosphate ABC transporter permease subunit PstC [Halochromatium glycolicum]
MSPQTALLLALLLASLGFVAGYRRAWSVAGSRKPLHSLPRDHGLWVLLCMLLPALAFTVLGLAVEGPLIDWLLYQGLPESLRESEERSLLLSRLGNIAAGGQVFGDVSAAEQAAADRLSAMHRWSDWLIGGGAIALAFGGGLFALPRINHRFRARNRSERIILALLLLASTIAILTTAGVVFSLLSEALRFFAAVNPLDFFFGLKWSPQTAIRAGQVGAEGAFGVVPVLLGTLLIASIALLVAVPIGLLSAIWMVEFAPSRIRSTAKPIIEVLAGVPTVVYGFFAAVTVGPAISDLGQALGLEVSSESALAAGSVMGIMIIPYMSSLADDVIASVPQRLRDGAMMLGATQGETLFRVVLPAALPGLLSAVVLSASRALGETMIVVMAAGLFANLTLNPLESVTTVTVQITTALTGDQPFDSPTTLSAFALGLTLFFITLALNLFALRVMERWRERYD